jgi:hypothetical protein
MIDLDAQVLAPNFAVWSEGNRGQPVPSYVPSDGGAASSIDGIFRIPSNTLFGGGEAPGLTSRRPELDIRASQVPRGITIAQGGTFTVRGIAYLITDQRPDGEGLITLHLSEAPIS